eukprot:170099-Chlamydomonas_euryale.AAC.1
MRQNAKTHTGTHRRPDVNVKLENPQRPRISSYASQPHPSRIPTNSKRRSQDIRRMTVGRLGCAGRSGRERLWDRPFCATMAARTKRPFAGWCC